MIQVYVPPFWLGWSGWNFPYAQKKKFVQVTKLAQLPGSCEEALRSNHVYEKCLGFILDIPLWVKNHRTWYLLRTGGSFRQEASSSFIWKSLLGDVIHPTRIKLSSWVLLCRTEQCGRRLCGPFSSSTKILSLTSLTTFLGPKRTWKLSMAWAWPAWLTNLVARVFPFERESPGNEVGGLTTHQRSPRAHPLD